MSKRKPGYYWVRDDGCCTAPDDPKWAVAFWDGTEWYVADSERYFDDADFAEIDEQRIERTET